MLGRLAGTDRRARVSTCHRIRRSATRRADRNRGTRAGPPIALIAACVLLAVLAAPRQPPPRARGLTTGFADPDDYQSTDAAQRATSGSTGRWTPGPASSGSPSIWPAIAGDHRAPADPTNPGSTSYNFSSIDGAVRDAAGRGLKVLLTDQPRPHLGRGPGPSRRLRAPGTWKPNPSDLADFAQAVAARYAGSFDPDGAGPSRRCPPRRRSRSGTSPTARDWLNPQFEGKTARRPDLYRSMLNASYTSIKAVNPEDASGRRRHRSIRRSPRRPLSPRLAARPARPSGSSVLCVTPGQEQEEEEEEGQEGRRHQVREDAGLLRPVRCSTSSPTIRSTTPAAAR